MRVIRGKRECPFAWRVRIAAREKDLPFEWMPFDDGGTTWKSPTLIEDGFQLTESLVIIQYLDEAFPERPLQALGARERAQMRLRMAELGAFEKEEKFSPGYEALEPMLADGRTWLGGDGPDLSDVAVWPFLAQLEKGGHPIPDDLKHATAYWTRARDRDSLVSTRPR
ncbi:MAG: glutathione S-transferase family protein [Myxococcales bacterium]|nr:glutathione S-transferase [Myxococcales bacterium]